MTLTPQESNLARECASLRTDAGGVAEDIEAILIMLDPNFDVMAFRRIAGGRRWWVQSARAEDQAMVRQAVLDDPSGDMQDVARRHHVPVSTVYFWRNQR